MKRILYHLTIPPPKMVGSEAVVQEIDALRVHFGGDLIYLNPNDRLPLPLPRMLFGFHRLRQLHALERGVQIDHLFNPDPFAFPVLRFLRRPVIYSLTGGVGDRRIDRRFFASLAAVTVSDERSLKRLQAYGLDNNVYVIPPGIDKSRFTHTPLPLTSKIRLMVGSAPWSRAQFHSKGIDALLQAVQRCPELHLTFLWRGVLFDEMQARVRRLNIERQVEVLNERVDVNRVLARVHGSITLATRTEIIRPYPHSLIESLAAGKPVLVSRCIPMADYVARQGCGLVVENTDADHLLDAIHQFSQKYHILQNTASQMPSATFSRQAMIACWERVYEAAVCGAKYA